MRIPDGQNRRSGLRAWPVLLLCLLVAGCSATRFAYNQLDWVLVWYIGGYFSLEDDQEDHLKEIVRRNLEWHRTVQLPEYVALLGDIERVNAAGAFREEDLRRFYEEFIVLWDEFVVHATPDVTNFLAGLEDEQVDEFIANLEEHNQELWDEYAGATPEQRIERREKALLRGLKRMFGRLSDEQEELVRAYLAGLDDVSEEWIDGRRLWQQAFRDLILERPEEPGFSTRMLDLMLDPNQFDAPEYRQVVRQNYDVMYAMISALSARLTDKQRARFSKRIDKLTRNLEILASQQT